MRKKTVLVTIVAAAAVAAAFFILRAQFGALYVASPIIVPSSTIAAHSSTAASGPVASETSSSAARQTSTIGTAIPTSPPNIGHSFGIATGGGLSKVNTSTLNQELDRMISLGVQWVRFDIEWGDVQYGSPTNSDWNSYDRLVKALAAHKLQGLGTITYTPQWARAPSCTNGVECPPADPATFATFVAEVAARYKSYGMHYWEIWNEPNNAAFWAPKTDCAAYAKLIETVYTAAKRADPNAVIVTGGLSPESTDGTNVSPNDFLSCIYANGAQGSFDAVGDHPYTFPASPAPTGTNAWAQMSVTSPSLRSIMVSHGDGAKKIWITEFGTPTDGPDPRWYVSETQQAQMAIEALGLYRSFTWAGPLFWYTFNDGGASTNTNENFFGLLRYDGSAKPAYFAIQSIIASGL